MTRIKLNNKVLSQMYQDWITIDTCTHTANRFIEYFSSLGWDLNFDVNAGGYTIPENQAPFFLLTYSQ